MKHYPEPRPKRRQVGRPRRTQDGFNIDHKDLKVELSGPYLRATATITHIPTGIVVEGHNPNLPRSGLAARVVAMKLLKAKLEEHKREGD